jgi:four helix bundle suffix protein
MDERETPVARRAFMESRDLARTSMDSSRTVPVPESPSESVPRSNELVANAALSLLNLACHFLNKQISSQADAFVEEGGFTERLYRVRSEHRRR